MRCYTALWPDRTGLVYIQSFSLVWVSLSFSYQGEREERGGSKYKYHETCWLPGVLTVTNKTQTFPYQCYQCFYYKKNGFHQVQLTIERRRLPDHHNFWQEVVCRQLGRGRVEVGGWLVVKIKGQAAPGWLQKSRYW